uniref:Uncharacterized protein n=1 Tax=Odontella aurita TaxID=265563 RepID=A0A7S4I5P7_9STRA
MLATRRALSAASGGISRKRTLALSVQFLHPKFGMKKHEILSRATAFLLAVDPPDADHGLTGGAESAEVLLKRREEERSLRLLRQHYSPDPAGGPQRPASELGWLEFCPSRHRPLAHVVAASHVVSPWMWPAYYPHDWLKAIELEHCAYSLEVFDSEEAERTPGGDGAEALAKFGLNPYPIHHPTGMDLAIMHIKNEETALKHMQDLGVEMMHLRDDDNHFQRGEKILFEGFEVADDNAVDGSDAPKKKGKGGGGEDDERTFFPFSEPGHLIFASPERLLAETDRPLPEGLCGGPTIDGDGRVAGIVEGIVPLDHDDERLRGAAAFLPSPLVRDFIQWAEKEMLERIVPKKVFDKVCEIKAGKALFEDQPEFNADKAQEELEKAQEEAAAAEEKEKGGRGRSEGPKEGKEFWEAEGKKIEKAYDSMAGTLKDRHTPEEVEAIMATIERERQEVIDTLTREGGDIDEIIAKVRRRTRERQAELYQEINEEMAKKGVQEGEIVSEEKKEDDTNGRKS